MWNTKDLRLTAYLTFTIWVHFKRQCNCLPKKNHWTTESFAVMNLEITKVFLGSAVGDMVQPVTKFHEIMWNYKICRQKKIKLQPEIPQNFIQTNLEYSNLERGMRVNPSFAWSSRVDLLIISIIWRASRLISSFLFTAKSLADLKSKDKSYENDVLRDSVHWVFSTKERWCWIGIELLKSISRGLNGGLLVTSYTWIDF